MISFIHIGKTGGTTIQQLLRPKIIKYREYHLVKNYSFKYKFIIWLRNPISRFVSAFNQSYYVVNVDISSIKSFDLSNCLVPEQLKYKKNKKYVFSEYYDNLIKLFDSPNDLAESLTSENPDKKSNAIKLMNSLEEHIFKGIGWYLDNGDFVSKNYDKILFVGKLETMKDDIDKLAEKLGIKLDSNLKIRENIYIDKSKKYLSELAIVNIINFYKNTDYLALEKLYEHGFISQSYLESCYLYEYVKN